MKKLPLKESAQTAKEPKHVLKAVMILDNAREEIRKFIAYQIPLLYTAFGWDTPNFSEDEEYVISTGDLPIQLAFKTEVDNSYLRAEERCYETVEVAEIVLSLDGTVHFNDEDGRIDWEYDEISIEELAAAADALELAYINTIKK